MHFGYRLNFLVHSKRRGSEGDGLKKTITPATFKITMIKISELSI